MKRWIRAALAAAVAVAMLTPGAALAAGNTTTIEQKWIDFQKAVTDQMVKDGKMTRQDADARMTDLKTRLAESPGDSVYDLFADKGPGSPGGRGGHGPCKDGKCHGAEAAALHVYSMMTGKSVDDLKALCSSGSLTIWQLAKKDGRLDELKSKILTAQAASLDELVKGGMMTAEQRAKILTRMKDELDKK